ncbi:ATP-dependent helicase NAM7 [Nannizzia gypsea CBS 118893]|uniref:ATP-dependent helicase NAM7 n=1 Tax=Arthroderma gypseum (strain ATCC MYA-4604 / CBS 118893) TaxID=535722 RepID=E4V5W7_ARTGP|nr:ATP-dependent helicase NAM7 [Nannizzia gypsea CBS 118893]EFR05492.1 ATP-dependent helicase NAM7 [Nannizzia gypsea CBS 118893]
MGPPGTGKTTVSTKICEHLYDLNVAVLVICGSNHGLDVLSARLANTLRQNMQGHPSRTPGFYRLDSDTREDADPQMALGVASTMATDTSSFFEIVATLQRTGIDETRFRLLQTSIEASLATGSSVSLGAHILARLQVAAKNPSVVNAKELELLQYIAYRILLSRKGYLFAEVVTDVPGQPVTPYSPKARLKSNEDSDTILRELMSEAGAAWLKLQEYYISQAKVIFCTASTASRKSLQSFKPAVVIVEEASQLTESMCLNGISKYYASLKKVVLSGDLCQLPPTVSSLGKNEFCNPEKVSLFERMIKTGVPHTMLRTQYRMHPDISDFVNATFCSNPLVNGSSLRRNNSQMFSEFMTKPYSTSPGASYYMAVANSSVWQRKWGTSLVNPKYAVAVANLVSGLINFGCPQNQILVLSYYSEELSLLKELLNRKRGLKDIVVQSVDASQGNEKSIVIVSTTRVRLRICGRPPTTMCCIELG